MLEAVCLKILHLADLHFGKSIYGLSLLDSGDQAEWVKRFLELAEDVEKFLEYNGMECCECGCCSYICPAKRQLTQSIKTMRKLILANKKKK